MRSFYSILFICLTQFTFGQIKGKVTNVQGQPMPFVNIYIKDTYIGTTSNDNGNFELYPKQHGTYTVLFQFLGYKTEKQVLEYAGKPLEIDIILKEENIELNEVVIDPKANPANEIIKKAIANRKTNSAKTGKFTC